MKKQYSTSMKNPLLYLLPLAFLLGACGQEATEETPEDLAGLRQLLAEKQSELRTIQNEIADLQDQISELDPTTRKRALVSVMPVEKAEFNHYVEIQGSVQTDDLVYVSSETGGRIIDLRVEVGDNVSRGQLIAKLDLESIQKQIAEVETSLELAREVYERQNGSGNRTLARSSNTWKPKMRWTGSKEPWKPCNSNTRNHQFMRRSAA